MPQLYPKDLPRCAVVDLGSNSVRLVVFEGFGRNPSAIFNEKAVLRLGRGLQGTGRLNDDGIAQALMVMNRYGAIARAMKAEPFEILATAAVRDAENGPEFVAAVQRCLPGVPIHVLTGHQEADLSAAGLRCGISAADGILADIGGGSLELVRLLPDARSHAVTLKLGVIRLSERAGGDLSSARSVAEADLATVPWLKEGIGRDLYLVGGAWRALARLHIAQTAYPLTMLHHYTIAGDEARNLAGMIATASRRALERMPGIPRRRIDDLPYAAVVLRRLLRATGARRVVFSANGLREGWYMRHVAPDVAAEDPLLAAAVGYAHRLGRDPRLPPHLVDWTAPLFLGESAGQSRLREAACWMSDIGARDHPEYRAEQAYMRILRQPGIGMDHHARAFLALTLALRYEVDGDAPFLATARMLLSPDEQRRAVTLGLALRLAYTLSAGTPELLSGTKLRMDHMMTLELTEGSGVFAGESVSRRLEALASTIGVDARTMLASA